MPRSIWLPMLTALDCITSPFTVARLVRLAHAKHETQLADAERQAIDAAREANELRTENASLRESLASQLAELQRKAAELEARQAVEQSTTIHGFAVRGPGGWH